MFLIFRILLIIKDCLKEKLVRLFQQILLSI